MAFDHWWFGAFPDATHVDELAPEFAKAAARAKLSADARAALDDWRRCPSNFEQAAITSDEAAKRAHEFIWAFNLPGFDQLAERVLTKNGQFSHLFAKDTAYEIVITSRITPVSIVWHVLGEDRVNFLPGHMGNVLLRPDQIERATEMTRLAYAGSSAASLLDAARRYCSANVSDDHLVDVLNFLPDGLARAGELGRGFLSLARPQI